MELLSNVPKVIINLEEVGYQMSSQAKLFFKHGATFLNQNNRNNAPSLESKKQVNC